VTNDLDALLRALYVDLDDRVLPMLGWSRDHRPGRKPALSDAELACLAVAQQLLGIASERRWIRHARKNLAGMFPRLPGQSGYGKRLRACGGLLAAVTTELARDTASWHDLLRLVDSTPLPCAASRETVKRSDLAGHAGYGYCASHSRFFWGFRLYLTTTAEGMPVIWGLAHPGLGEREVTRALLERDHHLIRAGHPRRQGLRRPRLRGLRPRRPPGAPDPPGPQGRASPVREARTAAPVDRGDHRHPERAAHPSKITAAGPWPGSTPASPPASRPCPPRSGTTGTPAPRSSAP
jgi:hypothetical protein